MMRGINLAAVAALLAKAGNGAPVSFDYPETVPDIDFRPMLARLGASAPPLHRRAGWRQHHRRKLARQTGRYA